MLSPDDTRANQGPRRALGRGPGSAYEGSESEAEPSPVTEPVSEGAPSESSAEPVAGVAFEAQDEPGHAADVRTSPAEAGPEAGPDEAGPDEAGPDEAGPVADDDAGSRADGEPGSDGVAEAGVEAGTSGESGDEPDADDGRFRVVLDNFEGPFDLLLQLISKHKLDVTEVALSRVTDEFMVHIRAMGPEWDLDQTTEFLVVAATLLDLKAARLLPQAEVEDEADLALLEARDLLFARLLQYRAYKEIATIFAGRLEDEARRFPRTVGLEPHHAELLPEVALSVGPEGFARLAVKAMRPKPKPQVYVEHIHAPLVSVREQAEVVVARLRERGEVGFQELIADAPDTLTVVARFLALLELYRERAIALEQDEALGALLVSWSGAAGGEPLVTDEFDQEPGESGHE